MPKADYVTLAITLYFVPIQSSNCLCSRLYFTEYEILEDTSFLAIPTSFWYIQVNIDNKPHGLAIK